jgi:hypothetical protein
MVAKGQIGLAHCYLKRFEMDGAKALAAVAASEGTEIHQGMNLAGAEIGGLLKLEQTVIEGGLTCTRTVCKAGLELTASFHCKGQFSLLGARITGSLNCEGASFSDSEIAVHADGLQIQGNANFRGSHIAGTVRFRNADLTGDLDFSGATITVQAGKGLRLAGANVKGSVFLRKQFRVNGGVRLSRARVSGTVDFSEAAITSVDPKIMAIEALGLEVQGAMVFQDLQTSSSGFVSMNYARVGRLEDDAPSWKLFSYRIDGFEFKACDQLRESLGATSPARNEKRKTLPMTLQQRIDWLGNQTSWNVQPYEYTARILRSEGYESEAQKILIEKFRELRKRRRISGLARIKNWLLEHLLGFGYQTWRTLPPMLVMLIVGSFVFQRASEENVLVPKDSKDRTEFNRYAYSLDAFVPLVNLKQREAFIYVRPPAQPGVPAPNVSLYQTYFWLHTALGWILTTLAAAGLSGLVKRE